MQAPNHTEDPRTGPGALQGALSLLALTALLAASWQYVRGAHRARRLTLSAPVTVKLQTWEGEGGRPDPLPADKH